MKSVRLPAFGALSFVSLFASFSAQAFSMPLGNEAAEALLGRFPSPPSHAEIEAANVDFSAIVALNNCSGALVRYTSSQPDDKALVLTNGHCYEGGFLEPGQVVADKASSRTFRILTSDGRGTVVTLRAERVVYATMTDTDLALYRVAKTYGQIEKEHDVTALTLSSEHPVAATPIRIVSGYWRRIYSCSVSGFIPELREGDWIFRDSLKFQQPGCETIGGTSGSPIVDANTREVIGVNNTGNEDGERCTMNNPCEVDAKGKVTVEKGASYGQETYQIYSCLNADNDIDLAKPGCKLPRPARVRN